ncbi:MAG TPA: hypothetical protein VGX94_11215 [Terriglobia bacterium]|nr:hypothetical protein [Terriglobia bacterium]
MRHPLLVTGCVLGILLSCVGLFAEPLVVTVRVIDARNGKPYRKLRLLVEFLRAEWSPHGYKTSAEAKANLISKEVKTTDDKGEVTFSLSTPLPGVISVWSGPMACGAGYFNTHVVMTQGAVGENHCKTKWAKSGIKFQTKPGEIIYFATHVGLFEGALTK